jgi:hypothetical protein
MIGERKRKVTGVGLIVVGALFLLVANHVLIGWEHVWPLFPIAAGVLLLRAFRTGGGANQLVAGLVGVFLGAFLLLFSVGILEWATMGVLWPTIPLVVGLALLASQPARSERGNLFLEIGIVLFGLIALLFTTETIGPRVAAPFVRLWPLVLIVAGIVILKMRADVVPGAAGPDPDMETVRAVIDAVEQVDEVDAGATAGEPTTPPARPPVP